VALRDGLEGFDFLGCHLRKRMSGRLWEQKKLKRYYLHRWPSPRAMNRVRQRVRELTPRGRCHGDVRGVIAEINPVLRGWGQYFRTGNAASQFIAVDDYVVQRLRKLRRARAGRNLHAGLAKRWDREYFEKLGLHRLRGTIRYPGKNPGNRSLRNAASRRPPVSRVREIRTHGLNGGVGSEPGLRAD
jgi:RNA-directed DNA polymerase